MTDPDALAAEVAALRRRVEELERQAREDATGPARATLPGQAAASASPPSLPPEPEPSPGFAKVPMGATEQPAGQGGVDLESQIGARLVSIVSVILLVIGVGFFLNLAFDRGWIGPGERIYLGILGGIALWATGWFLHRVQRLSMYGQIVSAAGAVILYVALYVGHQVTRYQVASGIPVRVGLVLTAVVAALVLFDAVMRRAPWLAGLCMPLMAIAAIAFNDWPVVVVPYAVLLTGGVLAAAVVRDWPAVSLVAVPASTLTLLLALFAAGAPPWHVLGGTLVLLALHTLVGMRAKESQWAVPAQALAWLASWGLVLAALSEMTATDNARSMGIATGLLGVAAVGLALQAAGSKPTRWAWAGSGLVLLFFWAPIQWNGTNEAWAWAGLLAALVAATGKLRVLAWPTAGLAAWLLMRLAVEEGPRLDARILAVPEGTALFAVFVALAAAAWVLDRASHRLPGRAALGMGVYGLFLYLAFVLQGPGVTLAWTASMVALLAVGFLARNVELRIAGLSSMVAVLIRILAIDLAGVDPVWRVLTFLGVGGLLLVVGYAYARRLRAATPT